MKKIIFTLGSFLLLSPCVKAQPIAFGARVAIAYSYISLSGGKTPLETTGSSIGYQAGLFLRRDFKSFYIEANVLYTGNVGGTYVYESNEQKVTASFAGLPLLIGKKFYPGIRLFAGLVPTIPLSHTDFDIHEFMQATSTMTGGEGFMLDFLVGGGIEVSKITLTVQYEGGIAGGFMDHQTNYETETVYHHISMVSLGLAIRLN
jgi:hypothetical protein